MKNYSFRIYGDNIIECVRIINMIKDNDFYSFEEKLTPINQRSSIISLKNNDFILSFELIPGFEKSNKKRWKDNILNKYKEIGSILDETADAFITKIDGESEFILTIIEFCSALQAGNQAWQRSGRAYSCARTKIPYFYVIDLPKYELNPETRERLALRFPNCIVPYSYITYSNINDTIAYVVINKSQEYIETDKAFSDFDMDKVFNNNELGNYLLNVLLEKDNNLIIQSIKDKNSNFVNFLAPKDSKSSYDRDDINGLNPEHLDVSILNYEKKFSFSKKIANKSISGNLSKLHKNIQKYSLGIFSSDLPFGIIPKNNISPFLDKCSSLYNISDKMKNELIQKECLIITMIKGFKPRGDDNRPDRGIMPLLRMLFGENVTIMTVLYGPLIKSSYNLLLKNPSKLANSNGLWQTIINLSNYLLFDCPITGSDGENVAGLIKFENPILNPNNENLSFEKLDLTPENYREDDVDSLFYLLITFESNEFYGICNPPGGDWSGLSLIFKHLEYRWFSLPRVSNDKRPDHVVEFFSESDHPYLLIMESKDKPDDLEKDIGPRLSNYVKWLMKSIPNVELSENLWKQSKQIISSTNFEFITSGSFISKNSTDYSYLLEKSNCDIIFSCIPVGKKWKLEIFYKNKETVLYFINETKSLFATSCLIECLTYFKLD